MFLSPLKSPFNEGSKSRGDLPEDVIPGLQKVLCLGLLTQKAKCSCSKIPLGPAVLDPFNPDPCRYCRRGFRGHGRADLLNVALAMMSLPWVWPRVVRCVRPDSRPSLAVVSGILHALESHLYTAHMPLRLHTAECGFGKRIIRI